LGPRLQVLLQLEVCMCIDGIVALEGFEIICDNVAFLGVLGIGTI
jgi:hypothetical protein